MSDEQNDQTQTQIIDGAGIAGAKAPLPEGLSLYCKVIGGPDLDRTYQLHERVCVIGRAEDAEISLTDQNASRKHASIEVIARDHMLLKDLASTNGTKLNDSLVSQCKLNDGDVIEVGATKLRFTIITE